MKQKVVVIGGGIIGCLTAAELAKKGAEVYIVDKTFIGNEASGAAGGILFPLMPWNYDPSIYKLCSQSSDYYKNLEKDLLHETNIDIELIKSGIQVLAPYNENQILDWGKKNNIKIDEKNFNNDKSLLIKKVFQVNPPKLMRALKIYLKKLNITILENAEVINLEKNKNKNKIISCEIKNVGKIFADKFVIAAGAWSSRLIESLTKMIYPVRGHIIQYPKSDIKLDHIIYKDGIYAMQRKDFSIIVGSTLENVGFSEVNLEDSINFLNLRATEMIEELRDLKIEKHWYGFRPGSDNNKPTIKIDESFDNLIINSGHHRYGITMAPNTIPLVIDYVFG